MKTKYKKNSKTELKIDFKTSHFEVIDFTFCDLKEVLVTGTGYRSVYLAPRVLLQESQLKVPHRESYPSGLEETVSAHNKASVEWVKLCSAVLWCKWAYAFGFWRGIIFIKLAHFVF